MKIISRTLLTMSILVGIGRYVNAEEWKTYKFTDPEQRDNAHPDIIKLEKGDKVDFVNMITSTRGDTFLEVEISFDEDENIKHFMSYFATPTLKNNVADHIVLQNFETFYGPCTLKFRGRIWGEQNSFVMFHAKITRAQELKINNQTNTGNNVTVLPEETENMELILESSDDMVKWEKDVIGSKPKTARKKFYRLRAVKE